MVRRKFSRPPVVGKTSRSPGRSLTASVPDKIQRFKDTYVFERRILDGYRGNTSVVYTPAASLDGKSIWDTPEVKSNQKSAWVEAYNKIQKNCGFEDPCRYIRILFYLLRGSSLSIPTIRQVTSPASVDLVVQFIPYMKQELRARFISESQQAEVGIKLGVQRSGYPLGLAVYYTLTDPRSAFSALFCYCLAEETVRRIRPDDSEKVNVDRLSSLAKRYEYNAALDYALFPDVYREVWGSAIPQGFEDKACSVFEAALSR